MVKMQDSDYLITCSHGVWAKTMGTPRFSTVVERIRAMWREGDEKTKMTEISDYLSASK